MEIVLSASTLRKLQATSTTGGSHEARGGQGKSKGAKSNNDVSIRAWDPVTGVSFISFKTSLSATGGLAAVRSKVAHYLSGGGSSGIDYFASAQEDRAAIHFWTWGKDQPAMRCSTPARIGPLLFTEDGEVALGGGENGWLYAWMTSSGRLISNTKLHFKRITALSLLSDGHHIVTGGDDAILSLWSLVDILSQGAASQTTGNGIKPTMSWTGHSLRITSIHAGLSGPTGRFYTSSLDCTCKVWSPLKQSALYTFTYPVAINCVVVDYDEHHHYSGGVDGAIYVSELRHAASTLSSQARDSGMRDNRCMRGHSLAINCLALANRDTILISGGEDGKVITWSPAAMQPLRKMEQLHANPVTSLLVLPRPDDLLRAFGSRKGAESSGGGRKLTNLRPIAPFRKAVESTDAQYQVCRITRTRDSSVPDARDQRVKRARVEEASETYSSTSSSSSSDSTEIEALRKENKRLLAVAEALHAELAGVTDE